MLLDDHDAYALRCALSLQPVPAEARPSPLLASLLQTLDWHSNPEHRMILENLVKAHPDITAQVLRHDPLAPPPPVEDDHAYVNAYLQQVTTLHGAAAPDTRRTNGSTALLETLHRINQTQGPAAASEYLQKNIQQERKLGVKDPQRLKSGQPLTYYDQDRIIQAGEVTAIIGQPGSGKSFWILSKLAELSDTMPVIYVAAEGINVERIYALEAARGGRLLSSNLGVITEPVDFTNPADVELLIEAIEPRKPRVVALDTFAACTPGIDENSSRDVQPVLNRIREALVARLGCAVVLIHHTTKDGKSFRGSSALRGNVANMYYLTQEEDLMILRSDKQRDSEPSPDRYYRLAKFDTRLHPDTGEQLSSAAMVPAGNVSRTPASVSKQLTRNEGAVLELLNTFDGGLTTRAVQDATEISKATLWRTIQRLVKAGLIKLGAKGEPIHITDAGKAAVGKGTKN